MRYQRFWNRYRLKIISFLILLSIFYLLLESRRNTSTDISFPTTGFSDAEVQYELNQYHQIRNEYQLTGIILHWRRINGVQALVKTMLEHEDLFPHIVVWNNNPANKLTFQDLLISNTSRIEIINSDENIKDRAKYRACQLAKTNACFYVDDDWDIRMYIRSLYASFLLEPTILHAITDQFTYFTNLMWTFFDESIDLHTGFSWIGCGSIFSRENAVRHLKYLTYFLDTNANRDLLPQGDQFFAVWMNQLPAQFNGRMLHSSEGAFSSFENFDFTSIQSRASVLAIELLESTLRTSPNSPLFNRDRAVNRLVTYNKSPCSYNDRFIFFTNCLPINDLEQIPFNITTDKQRGTRSNLPNTYLSPYYEALTFFERHNTANAVDNNNDTCWKNNRAVQAGDLYGIDFQIIQTSRELSFSIEYLHETSFQESFEISISLNSKKWHVIPREVHAGIVYNREKKLMTFHSRMFPIEYQVFRLIKFTSLTNSNHSFHVCEVKLIN